MPEGVSHERCLMIRAFGAEILFSPASEGMVGAIALAAKEGKKRNAFFKRQFENPDNAEAHFLGTGQEILNQIPHGTIDALVSGVGTGGTIVGLTRAFQAVGCLSTPYVATPRT